MSRRFTSIKRRKSRQSTTTETVASQHDMPINYSVKENLSQVMETLGHSNDIVSRQFKIGKDNPLEALILFTDGLVDKDLVHNFIMKTLMIDVREVDLGEQITKEEVNFLEIIKDCSLPGAELSEISTFEELYENLLAGETILMLDGYSEALVVGSRGWEQRGIQEPSSEQVVRGPKDGFTETLQTNTALIRRRIKDPNLWIETQNIGKKTQTGVAIAYLNGVVDDGVVKEVKTRLKKINIDSILESGYIEQLIQDETFTPFPTINYSERPDAISAGILEGRVAILVDGTPFALLVPSLFVDFFQSPEDYYQRSDISSLVRLLRFFAFFLALLTPSAYIAVTTFHQEMIPTTLLISIAAQREGVPFPAYVEALIMEITFEILREAGIRLPRAVGSAISIVGTLILGQAAVEAGIVSAIMVIVVSLTAISSFVSPSYNMSFSVRLIRFLFMTLAATFGLFGIILGIIVMVMHLTSLRSFGIPYLSPMGPFNTEDQKDSLVRMPLQMLENRPRLINQKDIKREKGQNQKPPKPSK
ncbi:spore germination protein [Radiobacillus sp. PE A8.2]|uniref:spore germination protein n=1 Tax=Radiobacillus sp. PE A8.2 TaxID=3380349 RepID=UPI0038902DB1